MSEPILQVDRLQTHFETHSRPVKAVDGVNFTVRAGEILGLVGESGSGKSVTGFSIMGLVDHPGRVVGGSIRFDGQELVGLAGEQLRRYRGRRISMIFQDPMMTLNPVLRIDTQMVETLQAHQDISREAALERCRESLKMVGISAPEARLRNYPHQLSGGMRQRVAIAIALLNDPELIIADEPTTALDVTIQSQILAEVQRLVEQKGVAMILITHDLSVVAGLADRIAVMYAGRIVEQGPSDEIISAPRHPYTSGLIASVPSRNQRHQRLRQIPGMTPSMTHLPEGCPFHPRCPKAQDLCRSEPEDTWEGPRSWRCHFPVGKDESIWS
ncbi:ABC transporter ATP-binding protein [Fodinicurvata fenggangensis]|uniref:ABC transporter ATP-binding protein n=1 Tax=Fodinicurvata fenggangensis TaxID=1121830 RepID=UPI00047D32BE|nr:ABC transporter ATP-binding protein [Fodinicurvata fenggangensis]